MEGKWPETATIGINGVNTIMAFELVHTNTCELSFMALIYH